MEAEVGERFGMRRFQKSLDGHRCVEFIHKAPG
jgi:hypothetical protein